MLTTPQDSAPLCAAADPDVRPARFTPPANACDCHAHVFGPVDRYPYVADRTYTPPDASFEQYQQILQKLGLERGVIVQPSVLGTDNRATLDAVAAGGEQFRAVVVVNEDISAQELQAMYDAGARGVRINLLFRSNFRVDDLRRLATKLADANMHLQLLVDVSQFSELKATLGDLPVELVFDHMGHMPTTQSQAHAGFQDLLALVGDGKAWVKLSGSYRFTAETSAPYQDVTAVAQALISTNPERMVWASDWPHPHIPLTMPNDGDLLDMLALWAPDDSVRNRILVDNPSQLYGF
ncbi:amidohydrolase family protein [Marinobacterium jannaschii]|uniref:amidohydrolase family protein n=1 Tax=Marinobacterium jannaschii TaxID=64970 RepID=UPI000563FBDB|nr:amidohydrolase family protein [Marinobacterium jannaschii]